MARSEGWLLILLIVIGFILWRGRWHRPSPAAPHARPNVKPTPQPLKPRTPDHCPACRAAQPGLPPASILPKPYSQVKSPPGRSKRIVTAGYAWPTSACQYYGTPDDTIPGRVGCGRPGPTDSGPNRGGRGTFTRPSRPGSVRGRSLIWRMPRTRSRSPSQTG